LGGGSSSVSYEIGKRYVANGHDVDVVTMSFEGLSDEESVDGMTVHRVPCLRRNVELSRIHELASYVHSAKRFLGKYLKHTRFDVNHTHFLLPTGIIARWIKSRFGLAYVISAHGSDVPGFNPDRFRLAHRFTRPLLKSIGSDADRIVAMSDYLAGLIRENVHDYSAEHLIRIRNGIDTAKFRPTQKKNIILATGRLLPRKGFQHLIRAVSEEDIGFELHICGDGPMWDELRHLAVTSKTKVLFHGWLNNQSALYLDLLGSAAIYVLASERENSSIALLEAMSAGCATVTTTAAGCRETVGDAGILFRPGDSRELKQALCSLVSDEQLRLTLQQKAIVRARENFDWNGIVAQYEDVLTAAAGVRQR
jgi:glycosyltransferase involved in cell wall biosynthesis